jgi:hypothetical protein
MARFFRGQLSRRLVLATSRCALIMWALMPFADSYFSYLCFWKTDAESLCADRTLARSYVFYFLLTSVMQSGGLL